MLPGFNRDAGGPVSVRKMDALWKQETGSVAPDANFPPSEARLKAMRKTIAEASL